MSQRRGPVESQHPSADRFIVWVDGDTLHLKRITPPPVTAMVEQVSEAEPMSLEEINKLVHDVRREQRDR